MAEQPGVAALIARLAGFGYDAEIECFDRLAVVRLEGREHLAPEFTAQVRLQLISEARACGFTHVAVELPGDGGQK